MTVSKLSPWQDPEDGFPLDGYFAAVADQLGLERVDLGDWGRDERWEAAFEIRPDSLPETRYSAADEITLCWRCDEHDKPKATGFTGRGWYLLVEWHLEGGGTRSIQRDLGIHPVAHPTMVVGQLLVILPPLRQVVEDDEL